MKVHRAVRECLPELVGMLQSVGLSVGQTEDPEALELQLNYNPNPFNLRVSASLLHDGVPVLRASSTNTGWGTLLARGAAVNGRAQAMLNAFEDELEDLAPRITIRPDASSAPEDTPLSTREKLSLPSARRPASQD